MLEKNDMNLFIFKGTFSILGSGILQSFVEVKNFLFIMLALVICDLITGIQKAKKKGEKIHSFGLRRTTQKFVMYSIAVMLSKWMTDVFYFPIDLVYIVALFISITEFKSNLENISYVTGVSLLDQVYNFIKPSK